MGWVEAPSEHEETSWLLGTLSAQTARPHAAHRSEAMRPAPPHEDPAHSSSALYQASRSPPATETLISVEPFLQIWGYEDILNSVLLNIGFSPHFLKLFL